MDSLLTIGWRERVSLPVWGIAEIEAKADTGARSSAIDVKNLKVIDESQVYFEVALSRVDRTKTVPVTAPLKRHILVKSSNGHISERVVVETTLQIGEVQKTIDVTLICRKRMQCRMLIGRTALQNDFLVHSNATYLLSPAREKIKKRKKKLRTEGLTLKSAARKEKRKLD